MSETRRYRVAEGREWDVSQALIDSYGGSWPGHAQGEPSIIEITVEPGEHTRVLATLRGVDPTAIDVTGV